MEVVIVDTTITTPPTGGANTFVVELCAALAARGDTVSLVAEPGPEQSLVRALRESGVGVYENVWRAVDLPDERARRLADWVNARRADVYVVSISPDAGWLALPLLDARVATADVVHSDGNTFYDPLKHYESFIDCAVGVSRETVRKIVSYCGVPPERARQIPYGVSSLARGEMEARAQSSSGGGGGPLRVGYVGRLVNSQKRVLDLVPLAGEARRRGVNFEMHVVGDGPERAALEAGFRAGGLAGRVRFWGWLSSDQVKARLRELDVLLLVSDLEGLPVAMLEAMGHGAVPVVTRIDSGTGELVRDGVNGFLADVGDFAAFADRLATLERDRARLAAMSLAAWETSQDYTVGRMVDRYAEAFAEIRETLPSPGRRSPARRDFPPMRSCVSRYPHWLRKIKRRVLVSAGAARR